MVVSSIMATLFENLNIRITNASERPWSNEFIEQYILILGSTVAKTMEYFQTD